MTISGNLQANRILRPYDGLENFENLLDPLEFRVIGQVQWRSDNDLIFRFDDYIKPGLQIRIDTKNSLWQEQMKVALKDISTKSSDIELVGLVRTSGIKKVKEVFRKQLQDILKSDGELLINVDLDSEPRLLPNQESALEIYLILAKNGINKFPLPYLKGTWLSQRIIAIQCEQRGTFEFDWLPLDDEERADRNLHKNSLHFIENICPLHQGETLSDCTKAYLDPEFKLKLEGLENGALQKYLLANLICEVICSTLIFTVEKLRREGGNFPLWAEIEQQGMLGRVLQAFSAKGSFSKLRLEPEDIYRQITEKPELIREYVEDFFKLRNLGLGFESSLEEN